MRTARLPRTIKAPNTNHVLASRFIQAEPGSLPDEGSGTLRPGRPRSGQRSLSHQLLVHEGLRHRHFPARRRAHADRARAATRRRSTQFLDKRHPPVQGLSPQRSAPAAVSRAGHRPRRPEESAASPTKLRSNSTWERNLPTAWWANPRHRRNCSSTLSERSLAMW